MTDNAGSEEHTNRTTAMTTQGHAFSDGDWLDSHYEAAREAYEAAVHYAGIWPGWKLLDAGAGGSRCDVSTERT